jgi:hypothetical protein
MSILFALAGSACVSVLVYVVAHRLLNPNCPECHNHSRDDAILGINGCPRCDAWAEGRHHP